MSVIKVTDVGNYGFDAVPIMGVGLSAPEVNDLQTRIDNAVALADAIAQAMTDAREQGLSAFN
ncbi:MAG: hypothetical protein VW831_06705, partial [Gammaproteobacteria bacterium]